MKTSTIFFTIMFIVSYSLSNINAQTIGLYGMTSEGGENDIGVVFLFKPSDNTFTKQLDFNGTANGSSPNGALMNASDGKLYGMTYEGGAYNFGVLFDFDPSTLTYTKKLDFNYAGAANGSYPRGSLMQALDGKLYGMAQYGGTFNWGVLFEFNPTNNTYKDDYDFGATGVSGVSNAGSGQYPYGSLMQATDGNLYGMTTAGGSEGFGVLFKYNPATSTYTKELDFGEIGVSGPINGDSPYGSLIQANDGKIYGMTSAGGTDGDGVLFQYNPANNAYVKKVDFTGLANGSTPAGSLVKATDGNLYGMTYKGGANNQGVLFQYNPANSTFTKKVDFDGATNGSSPYGSLMQATDGNLYGMTKAGGANGAGVLFQYSITYSSLTKLVDLDGANGKSPVFSNLVEIILTGINESSPKNTVSFAPNPATNQLSIHTSSIHNETVTVSIMNVLGEIMLDEKLRWSNDMSIEIESLPAGIYFLQMKSVDGSVVKRFAKE